MSRLSEENSSCVKNMGQSSSCRTFGSAMIRFAHCDRSHLSCVSLCKPFLDSNPRLDFPNTRMFKQILQLRTGYSILNDYRLNDLSWGSVSQDYVNVDKWRQCSITYFSVNYTKKRGIYYITDFENSWVFTHQMFTPYLGMKDIGKYQAGENR